MSCEYCKAGSRYSPLIDTMERISSKGDFFPGILAGMSDGELWFQSVADTHEPSFQEASVDISFCPMCGRRLVNTEE